MKQVVIARFTEDLGWTDNLRVPFIIYDKGPGGDTENIGREADTFARHIVLHYNDLPEYVAFLQGAPLDHCKELFTLLDPEREWEEFRELSDYFTQCDTEGRPHAWQVMDLRGLHRRLGLGGPPESFHFAAGAQFIVSRNRIHQHSIGFWKQVLEVSHEPEGPWELERMWRQILGPV